MCSINPEGWRGAAVEGSDRAPSLAEAAGLGMAAPGPATLSPQPPRGCPPPPAPAGRFPGPVSRRPPRAEPAPPPRGAAVGLYLTEGGRKALGSARPRFRERAQVRVAMAARDAGRPGAEGSGRASAPPLAERLPLVQGFTVSPSQKNKTALRGRKSAKDGLRQEPVAPLQTSATMCAVNSSDTTWLLRPPRPVTECDQQRPRLEAADGSRDIIASVQCILDRENYFVREADRYLRHNDFLNLRKKEMLYKKWLEDVSEPLLQKIQDKMDSQSSEEIRKRKEEQHSLYLNYRNKKGYVTLEDYDPSEYDPLFLTTRTDCWKVSIPTLQDPLLENIQRRFAEMGVIKQCETGRPYSSRELKELSKAELPLLPLSRQRMDAIEWLKVPHSYIASEVHQKKRKSSATTKMARANDVTLSSS